MLREHDDKQIRMEFVSIEELVPQDHLLRKIERVVDFSFIREKVKDLYCADNGRPAVDPVILFKMLFLGYLFGVRSERQLVREIQVNVAYRWFLGFGLTDKIPDATTFCQNRRRRFNKSRVYQEIFDEIVLQAMQRKWISGRVLYTDSTHLKANANKNRFTKEVVAESTRSYLAELEDAIASDREAHGKKPLPAKEEAPASKEIKVSTTDPESGFMVRDGKPTGFFYLDHRTVDGRHSLITDTFVTPANVHDSVPYLERLDRQRERFGFAVEAVGLDAGYMSAPICRGLEQRDIYGVIAYRRPNHVEGMLRKREFVYEAKEDGYRCPAGQMLRYRTTTREGYREYASDPKICCGCPLLGECTRSANRTKVVTRHVWEESRERVAAHRLSETGREIYSRRKETVERSFADAKQLHGHRYARMRGQLRVMEQCLLAAVCQNLKKMALLNEKEEKRDRKPLFRSLWRALRDLVVTNDLFPATAST